MNGRRFIAIRSDTCIHCGFCEDYLECSKGRDGCIGCGACVIACPQGARTLKAVEAVSAQVRFTVDGRDFAASGGRPVKDVLRELRLGGPVPSEDGDIRHALCETGGCWSCAVLIDGVLVRSCRTPLQEGMHIVTDPSRIRAAEPRRVVTLLRPAPHFHPSIFVHGCNYRCDLCHNWEMTFASTGSTLTPQETITRLGLDRERDYWVGISGGEPTLNRGWLVETVQRLRRSAPDVRIQLDTNASLLTADYIDELVDAGMTDFSPDLKSLRLETLMKLCGLDSPEAASQYLERSWQAVRYVNERYGDRVFMAVSLPYHPAFHSTDELQEEACMLAAINPAIAVTLIEYQPAFRLRHWPFIRQTEMEQAHRILAEAGLRKILVQGGIGIPRAVDPMDLCLGSEEF